MTYMPYIYGIYVIYGILVCLLHLLSGYFVRIKHSMVRLIEWWCALLLAHVVLAALPNSVSRGNIER